MSVAVIQLITCLVTICDTGCTGCGCTTVWTCTRWFVTFTTRTNFALVALFTRRIRGLLSCGNVPRVTADFIRTCRILFTIPELVTVNTGRSTVSATVIQRRAGYKALFIFSCTCGACGTFTWTFFAASRCSNIGRPCTGTYISHRAIHVTGTIIIFTQLTLFSCLRPTSIHCQFESICFELIVIVRSKPKLIRTTCTTWVCSPTGKGIPNTCQIFSHCWQRATREIILTCCIGI